MRYTLTRKEKFTKRQTSRKIGTSENIQGYNQNGYRQSHRILFKDSRAAENNKANQAYPLMDGLFYYGGEMIKKNKKGFTMIELIVTGSILSIIIVGLMRLFIYTSVLAEIAGNKTTATSEAQSKLEEIRNHDFDQISTDYAEGSNPGNNFNLTLLNGNGVIYIGGTTPELLTLRVVISWQNKYNRDATLTLESMLTKR